MNKVNNITLKELSYIIIGSTIFAIGINWFIAPLDMVTGGVSGLAIIIRKLSEEIVGIAIPLYVTNLILNIPLFIIGIIQRGLKFAKKSLYSVIWISFALWFTEFLPNIFDIGNDILLAAIFGGVFTGLGVGIVLKTSATTGGSDMLASIIKFYKQDLSIAQLILLIDGIIILSGLFIFGARSTMYAIIAVIIGAYVMNSILDGMHFAKAAFIMSSKNEEISKAIIIQLKRGNTGIKAQGMYTKLETDMLLVVVAPREIAQLRKIVKNIDAKAFIIISDVKEVLGEGFTEEYDALTS